MFGIIVCGGKSTRMGREKCLLEYHGVPQWQYIYKLLQPFCEKILISCNKDQVVYFSSATIPSATATDAASAASLQPEYIEDDPSYHNTGPMASLLTAFKKYPFESFLLIGCDYPFLKTDDLIQLINGRNANANAVSFFNPETNSYEPMLAVYENTIYIKLVNNFNGKKYSLRFLLEEVNAKRVKPSSSKVIRSVDNEDDVRRLKL